MTQLGEMVHAAADADDKSCPFPHFPPGPGPVNQWTNSAADLGSNLASEFANGTRLYLPHIEETSIGTGPSGRKNLTATYNPHHLLPGDATWPHTKLKRWVDDPNGDVRADIGYDVNAYRNGIDLPSNNEMRGNWTLDAGRSPDFQVRYAFAAMDAEGRTRQFHDSHKAYSDFAIKVLDKIAARLDAREQAGNVGCGHKHCPANNASKKYPAPLGLLSRIHGTSKRLAKYLYGSPRSWRKPIMTSKFALMYKNRKLSHDQAREQLEPDKFVY